MPVQILTRLRVLHCVQKAQMAFNTYNAFQNTGNTALEFCENTKSTAVLLQAGHSFKIQISVDHFKHLWRGVHCPSLVASESLEVKHCDWNCSFNAQLNHHKVASRYWEIGAAGLWTGEWQTSNLLAQKAWPVFFPEFSKIQKKQSPMERIFQTSSPLCCLIGIWKGTLTRSSWTQMAGSQFRSALLHKI